MLEVRSAKFLVLAGLMTAVITDPAMARAPVQLACSVSGSQMLSPPLSADQVCARVADGLGKALKAPLARTAAPAGPEWIKLDVRFRKPGSASATMTRNASGRITTYPMVAVDVMDRSMDAGTVDMLVRELARLLPSR